MIYKMKLGFTVILSAFLLVTACAPSSNDAPTQEVNTVYTQAAQLVATQVSMQQTQTAMAVPAIAQSTPTLAPLFNTPTLSAGGGAPGSALPR